MSPQVKRSLAACAAIVLLAAGLLASLLLR